MGEEREGRGGEGGGEGRGGEGRRGEGRGVADRCRDRVDWARGCSCGRLDPSWLRVVLDLGCKVIPAVTVGFDLA